MLRFSLAGNRLGRDLVARVATINVLAWAFHMILYRYAGFQSVAPNAALYKQLVASAGAPSPAHRPSSARVPLLTCSP